MLAALISFTISTAVMLFVIGLVLQGHGAGIRRAAVALFLLALLPSVAVGLTRELLGTLGHAFTVDPLTTLLCVAAACVGAFGVLHLRHARSSSKPQRRVQMKRPYTHRRDTDFIEFLRREIDRDA